MHVRLLAVGLLAARAALAQSTTQRETPLLASPTGNAVASIVRGAAVHTTAARGTMVSAQLEGWVSSALLVGRRDSFEVSVAKSDVRLRAEPSPKAATVALLERGMGLHLVRRAGAWTHVRRTGWIARSALSANERKAGAVARPPRASAAPAPAARTAAGSDPRSPRPSPSVPAQRDAAAPPATTAPAVDSAATRVAFDALTPARPIPVSHAPGGRALGVLQPGAVLEPLAHDRGWVRVRVEGWVPERDLVAADTAVRSPSVADLRADPQHATGRVVRWSVEVLAYRIADALRPDLTPGEPYLLARGAGDENELVYLAVPRALVAAAQALAPMTRAIVTARVRTARSDPAGVPILDLLTLAQP